MKQEKLVGMELGNLGTSDKETTDAGYYLTNGITK